MNNLLIKKINFTSGLLTTTLLWILLGLFSFFKYGPGIDLSQFVTEFGTVLFFFSILGLPLWIISSLFMSACFVLIFCLIYPQLIASRRAVFSNVIWATAYALATYIVFGFVFFIVSFFLIEG